MDEYPPSEGERRALRGYYPQYHLATSLIIKGLLDKSLEKVVLVNPEAGRVDDILIYSTHRLDAYQVKWSKADQYWNYKTDFTNEKSGNPSILSQLVDGWTQLRTTNMKTVVHLYTCQTPSTHDHLNISSGPISSKPNHTKYFIENLWIPAKSDLEGLTNSLSGDWKVLWNDFQELTGLNNDDFNEFIKNCELDLGQQLEDTKEHQQDFDALFKLLVEKVGTSESLTEVELTRDKLLYLLGWTDRFKLRSRQQLPLEGFYAPLNTKINELKEKLSAISKGYIAILGPPGIGKSSFISYLDLGPNVILIKYYIHIPVSGETVSYRAQPMNFFHDLLLQFEKLGLSIQNKKMRLELSDYLVGFQNCLDQLHKKWEDEGVKTLIMIDGIDHIKREGQCRDPLTNYLSSPSSIPEGIYFVLSSQTISSIQSAIQNQLGTLERKIEIENLSKSQVLKILSKYDIGIDLTTQQKESVFSKSNGHPLALIYLLRTISQQDDKTIIEEILDQYPSYKTNIEEVYQSHWNVIKDDPETIKFFGEISRLRKYIPLGWVIQAYGDKHFKILNQFRQYFRVELKERAYFFHSSFQEFIQRETQKLLDISREDLNARFHLELVQKIKHHVLSPTDPFRYEVLYHLYHARMHHEILDLISQKFFRNQFLSFRSTHDIEMDIQLIYKILITNPNPTKFIEFILIGAEMRIRKQALEGFQVQIFEILNYLNKTDLVLDYCRDGYDLHVSNSIAFEMSDLLIDIAKREKNNDMKDELIEQVRILFNIADPVRLFEHSVLSRDDIKIMFKWIRAAKHFKSPSVILNKIDQEKYIFEEEEFKNLRAQVIDFLHHLIFERSLINDSQEELEFLLNQLDITRDFDKEIWIRMKLRCCNFFEQEKNSFHQVLACINELKKFLEREKCELSSDAFILLADIYRKNGKNLQDLHEHYQDRFTESLYNLNSFIFHYEEDPKYKVTQVLKLLNISLLLNKLDENFFERYPSNGDDQVKCAYHFRRAIILLAKISEEKLKNTKISMDYLKKQFEEFLNYFKSFQKDDTHNFNLTRAPWGVLFSELVIKNSDSLENLDFLKNLFLNDWNISPKEIYWSLKHKREILSMFLDVAEEKDPFIEELVSVESLLSETGDLHGRMTFLYEIAKIYMKLGKKTDVERLLDQMMRETFRIGYRKDYQLESLISSCKLFTSKFPDETRELLQRIVGWIPQLGNLTEGPAKYESAYACLDSITHFFPEESFRTFHWLLDEMSVNYFTGLDFIIGRAIEESKINSKFAVEVIKEYFIPLCDSVPIHTIQALIAQLVHDSVLCDGHISSLIDVIRTRALPSIRPKWLKEIVIALMRCGHSINKFDLRKEELIEELDKNYIILNDDSKLGLIDVFNRVRNIQEYFSISNEIKEDELFPWDAIIGYLLPQLSPQEHEELIANSKNTYFLLQLAKMYLQSGMTQKVRKICLNVLNSKVSKTFPPSGWSNPYYFELMAILSSIESQLVREKILQSIIRHTGAHTLYFIDKILVIDSIVEIVLAQDEGNLNMMWLMFKDYITTLFEGIPSYNFQYLNSNEPEYSFEKDLIKFIINNLEHDLIAIRVPSIKLILILLEQSNSLVEELLIAHLDDRTLPQYGTIQLLSCYIRKNNLLSPELITSLKKLFTLPNSYYRMFISEILPIESISIDDLSKSCFQNLDYYLKKDGIENIANPEINHLITYYYNDLMNELNMSLGFEENTLKHLLFKIINENNPRILFEKNYGKNMQNSYRKMNLNFHELNPEFVEVRKTFYQVIALLLDAGKINPKRNKEVKNFFYFDEDLVVLSPNIKPMIIPKPRFDKYNINPANFFANLDTLINDYRLERLENNYILAELTMSRILCHKKAMEERKIVSYYQGFPVLDFFRVRNLKIREYNDKRYSIPNGMIIQNVPRWKELTGDNWIAFNPGLGKLLGWHVTREGLFRWVDQHKQFMVETIWWNNGNPRQIGVHFCAISAGWIVVASEEAMKQIKSLGNLEAIQTLTRGIYQMSGPPKTKKISKRLTFT